MQFVAEAIFVAFKHQSSTTEKSSAQKPNQGVRKNVLKPTKEVSKDN